MPLKKLRRPKSEKVDRVKYWDSLPWKAVDVESENLGEFEETVFFGLEEVDGNAYMLKKNQFGMQPTAVDSNDEEPAPVKEKSKKRKAAESVNVKDVEASESAGESGDNTDNVEDVNEKKKRALTTEEKIAKYQKKREKKQRIRELKAKEAGETAVNSSGSSSSSASASAAKIKKSVDNLSTVTASWGGIELNSVLVDSLVKLNFDTPTPIQFAAIPRVLGGATDVVGAAETGSGKTLAFGLPIIHSLLQSWDVYHNTHSPFAMIIAPTRELAMQITSVFKEVCGNFKQQYRIEIVSIVGGMSEQKQRRQLVGTGKPLHIVVATPGRLCDIFQDETVEAFQDLSKLRFLVVDEADRIMEEGHFAELHRVFSRITDHEKIASEGQDPVEVIRRRKLGIDEVASDQMVPTIEQQDREEGATDFADELGEFGDLGDREFDTMPSEEEIAAARASQIDYSGHNDNSDAEEEEMKEEDEEDENENEGQENDGDDDVNAPSDDENEPEVNEEDQDQVEPEPEPEPAVNNKRQKKSRPFQSIVGVVQRQTLLFSATAVQLAPSKKQQQHLKKNQKDHKKDKSVKLNGTLLGIGQNGTLPDHLKKLLSLIAVQKTIHCVDVTDNNLSRLNKLTTTTTTTTTAAADKTKDGKKVKASAAAAAAATATAEIDEEEREMQNLLKEMSANTSATAVALPKGLSQYEVKVPSDEKDLFAYYYLLKFPGRSLLFVNSIKTARRVDGLLRALGINCRTIHAQLQQRQRLRALESFRSSPIGVLVATDVAARGLDIPKIQSVIHYDIARSPQVYIHRSGRTARANTTGTAISLPSPEDALHHKAICDYLGMNNGALPSLTLDLSCMQLLRDRIKLAKKIFTQSFVASQSSKEKHWLQQNANDADLEIDEFLESEIGTTQKQKAQEAMSKKALEKARYELKVLLDKPLDDATQKRGRGFYVYAK